MTTRLVETLRGLDNSQESELASLVWRSHHTERVSPSSTAEPTFRILIVCTGNICRSAFAQRLGQEWLRETLGEAAGSFDLHSAGTRAVVGSEMHPDTALVALGYGVPADDFRARQLTSEQPAQADLVLTMTKAHRQHVLGLAPRALARTFTLREAADLLGFVADGTGESEGDFVALARGFVAALAEARSNRVSGRDDDVPDPINQPADLHEHAGQLIVAALLPLLRRLADLRRAHPPESAESDAATDG